MQTSDFDYELPPELIAQTPPNERGQSRMMVVDRGAGSISHHRFEEISEWIRGGDELVLNDTRVVAARFFSNDGKIEILRVDVLGENRWKCLVKPGKRMRMGRIIEIGDSVGTVVEVCEEGGERIIAFDQEPDEEEFGHLALPPYIDRPDGVEDRDRYQTVYAKSPGAIAAPTAGLHFPKGMLNTLPHSFVTLHVGIGTFRPVSEEDPTRHHMHSERFVLGGETVHRIQKAERVIAVGTTVIRVLESCGAGGKQAMKPSRGETDIFIFPPYEFRVVGGLLTNFHLPKSTLIMLVSALAGQELILEAYRKAVEEKYRFFSYGDCMLII
ncbi:MAG: tRNA preQ1(34) S-adenosylmethionine ribosyltransferase-isomerase QueA [Verrucomicrobiota bacterium]